MAEIIYTHSSVVWIPVFSWFCQQKVPLIPAVFASGKGKNSTLFAVENCIFEYFQFIRHLNFFCELIYL